MHAVIVDIVATGSIYFMLIAEFIPAHHPSFRCWRCRSRRGSGFVVDLTTGITRPTDRQPQQPTGHGEVGGRLFSGRPLWGSASPPLHHRSVNICLAACLTSGWAITWAGSNLSWNSGGICIMCPLSSALLLPRLLHTPSAAYENADRCFVTQRCDIRSKHRSAN